MTSGDTTASPALKIKFLSHGTLDCADLDFTEKFYKEFLGLEVVRMSAIALCIRLRGDHTIVVVKTRPHAEMSLMNHNGLDVETPVDVDEAYRLVTEQKEKWRIGKIVRPVLQHGSYSFYFWDVDGNCWEILANPPRGYSPLFDS
jgi:catechol-2,3-dioxygenase